MGSGGCHNNTEVVQRKCRSQSNCEFVGQQSNGCWHLLKQDSNGSSKPSKYTKGFHQVPMQTQEQVPMQTQEQVPMQTQEQVPTLTREQWRSKQNALYNKARKERYLAARDRR